MPFISCSINAATVSSTTCALAPGYVAVTCSAGGATSGYCATGKPRSASKPASTMTIAMTQAKIGRSMKKRGSMSRSLALGCNRRFGADGRRRFLLRCGRRYIRRGSRWLSTRLLARRVGLRRRRAGDDRIDDRAPANLLDAVDHDAFASREPIDHDPILSGKALGLDRLRRDFILRADDVNELPLRRRLHRALRHLDHFAARTRRESHRGKHARQQ